MVQGKLVIEGFRSEVFMQVVKRGLFVVATSALILPGLAGLVAIYAMYSLILTKIGKMSLAGDVLRVLCPCFSCWNFQSPALKSSLDEEQSHSGIRPLLDTPTKSELAVTSSTAEPEETEEETTTKSREDPKDSTKIDGEIVKEEEENDEEFAEEYGEEGEYDEFYDEEEEYYEEEDDNYYEDEQYEDYDENYYDTVEEEEFATEETHPAKRKKLSRSEYAQEFHKKYPYIRRYHKKEFKKRNLEGKLSPRISLPEANDPSLVADENEASKDSPKRISVSETKSKFETLNLTLEKPEEVAKEAKDTSPVLEEHSPRDKRGEKKTEVERRSTSDKNTFTENEIKYPFSYIHSESIKQDFFKKHKATDTAVNNPEDGENKAIENVVTISTQTSNPSSPRKPAEPEKKYRDSGTMPETKDASKVASRPMDFTTSEKFDVPILDEPNIKYYNTIPPQELRDYAVYYQTSVERKANFQGNQHPYQQPLYEKPLHHYSESLRIPATSPQYRPKASNPSTGLDHKQYHDQELRDYYVHESEGLYLNEPSPQIPQTSVIGPDGEVLKPAQPLQPKGPFYPPTPLMSDHAPPVSYDRSPLVKDNNPAKFDPVRGYPQRRTLEQPVIGSIQPMKDIYAQHPPKGSRHTKPWEPFQKDKPMKRFYPKNMPMVPVNSFQTPMTNPQEVAYSKKVYAMQSNAQDPVPEGQFHYSDQHFANPKSPRERALPTYMPTLPSPPNRTNPARVEQQTPNFCVPLSSRSRPSAQIKENTVFQKYNSHITYSATVDRNFFSLTSKVEDRSSACAAAANTLVVRELPIKSPPPPPPLPPLPVRREQFPQFPVNTMEAARPLSKSIPKKISCLSISRYTPSKVQEFDDFPETFDN